MKVTRVSDEQLVTAIGGGLRRAGEIERHLNAEKRAVDRALQRARKKGLIEYLYGGWRVLQMPCEPGGTDG